MSRRMTRRIMRHENTQLGGHDVSNTVGQQLPLGEHDKIKDQLPVPTGNMPHIPHNHPSVAHFPRGSVCSHCCILSDIVRGAEGRKGYEFEPLSRPLPPFVRSEIEGERSVPTILSSPPIPPLLNRRDPALTQNRQRNEKISSQFEGSPIHHWRSFPLQLAAAKQLSAIVSH